MVVTKLLASSSCCWSEVACSKNDSTVQTAWSVWHSQHRASWYILTI